MTASLTRTVVFEPSTPLSYAGPGPPKIRDDRTVCQPLVCPSAPYVYPPHGHRNPAPVDRRVGTRRGRRGSRRRAGPATQRIRRSAGRAADAPGGAAALLHHLPQREAEDRRARARPRGRRASGRQRRGLGARRRRGCARARCRRPAGRDPMRRPIDAACDLARRPTSIARWAGGSESGAHRRRSSAEPHAIQQRHPRSVRARPRRRSRCCPATRRPTAASTTSPTSLSISTAHLERYLSVARQVTRLATGLAADRAERSQTFEIPLHVVQDDRQSDDLPFGSRGGIAVRYQLPGRRRIRHQGPAAPAVSGLPHGHGLAAAARRAARRQAAEALHRRRRREGPAGGGELRRRRRAGVCRRSRVGRSTCRSAATPASRSACRSRPVRASSASRSCASCGSRKACRSRCSAAAC